MDYFRPTIVVNKTMVTVEAPYNPEFIKLANQLGGVFRSNKWTFAYPEELDVRRACLELFGFDGITDPVKADVRVLFTKELQSEPNRSIDILSRPVARISDRGGDPLVAPGTIIKSGSITAKGKCVVFEKGTDLILRSVPVTLFNSHSAVPSYSIELIDLDHQALEHLFHEHDTLIKRLKEVEQLFAHADVDAEQFKEIVEQNHLNKMVSTQ